MPTVAEMIVEALVQVGVKRVYGVAGDSLSSIVDALRRHEGIAWVQVRHEEFGAFAAAAEAQLTGQLSVCAGIHMSDIPSFPYRLLWEERQIVSVANLQRQDGLDLLRLAPEIGIVTHTTT